MNQFNDTTISGDLIINKDGEEINVINEITGLNGNSILEKIYPIGSVYISTVYANPKNLFGFGEWEQIKDRFLLSGGDTYQAGTTGGSAYINLWHKHLSSFGFDGSYYYTTNVWGSQYVEVNPSTGGEGWGISGVPNSQTSATQMSYTSEALDSYGNTIGEKSILPPYLTVYMWKRIG